VEKSSACRTATIIATSCHRRISAKTGMARLKGPRAQHTGRRRSPLSGEA
jgi:hypothetical protein